MECQRGGRKQPVPLWSFGIDAAAVGADALIRLAPAILPVGLIVSRDRIALLQAPGGLFSESDVR
jgi:hypothetical protein